jgi:hypothetical protein
MTKSVQQAARGQAEEPATRRGKIGRPEGASGNVRETILDAAEVTGKVPSVRDIVFAFLTPTLALRATPEGRAFIRLQARLHTEPPEISYRLRNEAYEVSTRAYVEAFRRALPHLPEKDVYWRVTLMVGAYMYAFSDTHRLEEIAPGICHPEDPEEILAQITSFLAGGMAAEETARIS